MTINGRKHYLWRAVDHEGDVLESYVTKRRDRKSALRFLKKAMKRYGNPEVVVTDRLASYRAAMKEIGNERRQEVGRHLNNRAENSYLPFRRRERARNARMSVNSNVCNAPLTANVTISSGLLHILNIFLYSFA